MVYAMHGSCLDSSVFPKYVEAIMNKDFAYTDMLLGQKLLKLQIGKSLYPS